MLEVVKRYYADFEKSEFKVLVTYEISIKVWATLITS